MYAGTNIEGYIKKVVHTLAHCVCDDPEGRPTSEQLLTMIQEFTVPKVMVIGDPNFEANWARLRAGAVEFFVDYWNYHCDLQ